MSIKYTNNAATTLVGAHNASVTTIVVSSGALFPTVDDGADGNHFYVTFNGSEVVKVINSTSTNWTVERGVDGTAAAVYAGGESIELRIPRAMVEDTFTDSDLNWVTTGTIASTNVILNDAKVSADGLVTTHSDITNAGSGAIITVVERNKLTAIEAAATADQTGVEIKALYEAELNTNAFTDVEKTKLAGIESGATGDQTGAEIKALYEDEADTNAFDDAAVSKLAAIENSATADQTGAEIKAAYEAEADTNAYTDADEITVGHITVTQAVDLDAIEAHTVDSTEHIEKWVALTSYVVDSLVWYATDDSLYRSLTIHSSATTPDADGTNWQVMMTGPAGAAGADGNLDSWVTATGYGIGDVVWAPDDDKIYRAVNAHTSGVFATDLGNGDWAELSSADQTGAEIKTAYELEPNTNAFTDANVTTLGNQSGTNTGDQTFDGLSPMTTGGDIIFGGASGTGTRLANGSVGQVLTSAGTTAAPTWSTPASAGVADHTGVLTGGIMSTGAGAAQFSISDGTGQITDADGTITAVSWTGLTNITPTNIGTQLITFIGINSGGAIVEQATRFTNTQARTIIVIGVAVHVDNVNVDAVNNEQHIAYNTGNQLIDLYAALGFFNISGNVISANGANLNINKSIGVMSAHGANYPNDIDDPNTLSLPALTAVSFQYRFNDGTNGTTGIAIDPANLDDGAGGLTALSSNKKWSIQRVYCFTSNNVKIQRGTDEFDSKDKALAGIASSSFTTEPSIAANGLLRGWIIAKQNATDLSDPTEAIFIEAPKFQGSTGGIGSVAETMQQVYDNSTPNPEILTSTTNGALTVRRGSAADSDTVLETQNNAGTTTFSVDGNGNVVVSGTVDGIDIATDVAANTTNNTGSVTIHSDMTAGDITNLGNLSGTNTGDEVAATNAVAGIIEIATTAEVDTGTDNTRAITPASLNASSPTFATVSATNYVGLPAEIGIAVGDETSSLSTGTTLVTFRVPFAMTLTEVRASVTTAPTGSVITVDINDSGATILSTKLTIDATEKTSTTAATPPVLSDTSLADDAEVTIDLDTVGSTIAGAGLKIWLIGTRT